MKNKTKLIFCFVSAILACSLLFNLFKNSKSQDPEIQKPAISSSHVTPSETNKETHSNQNVLSASFTENKVMDYSAMTLEDIEHEISLLETLIEDENAVENLNGENNAEFVGRWKPVFEKLSQLQNARIEKKIDQLNQKVSELEEQYKPSHNN